MTAKIYFNDLDAAQVLLQTNRFTLDVETDTIPPAGRDFTFDFGLSYLTDITYLAISADCDPETVYVFQMPRMPDSLKWDEYVQSPEYAYHEERMRYVEFLRKLLMHREVVVTAHNAAFDMRLICGHYGVKLHKSSRVWDTRTVAIRFLMADTRGTSLDALIDFHGWKDFFSKHDRAFYARMKALYRKDVAQLLADLEPLMKDPVFQPYCQLNGVDAPVAIFVHYVALDVLHTSRVREEQRLTLQASLYNDVSVASNRLRRWSNLQLLLPLEGRIASEAISQTARGLKLNVPYATARLEHHQQQVKYHTEQALSVPDRTHTIPYWFEKFCLLRFYTNVFATLTTGATFSDYRKFPNFVFDPETSFQSPETSFQKTETSFQSPETSFQKTETNAETSFQSPETSFQKTETNAETSFQKTETNAETSFRSPETSFQAPETSFQAPETSFQACFRWVKQLLVPHSDLIEEDEEVVDDYLARWANWLLSLSPASTRSQILKSSPKLPIPSIKDSLEWVRETSQFLQSDHKDYLVKLKHDWYARYITERVNHENLLNLNSYKTFYLFVVCGLSLPTNEDISTNWSLVTKRVLERFQQFESERNSIGLSNDQLRALLSVSSEDDEIDAAIDDVLPTDFQWVTTAIELNAFATGKKALEYYFASIPAEELERHPVYHYAQAMQHEAWYKRTREFLEHALRDGRVHSLMTRTTTTGRFASSYPNLQNIDMRHFRGYFIPDSEDFVLIELDYANAENKTGAMISRDPAFARATEGGDFHSAQAAVYWPDLVKQYRENGETKKLKELRTRGKGITFGSAYGAGVNKLAYMIKTDRDKVREILDNMRRAYPLLTATKLERAEEVVNQVRSGARPAFVTLWDGSRVSVLDVNPSQLNNYLEQVKRASYRTWNYLQQGGVAQMVSRAMVEINDFLVDGGYETRIAINVHDSVILHAKVSEVDEILPKICEIMSEIVPLDLRQLVKPFIHFVTEVGPENAFKWGWVEDRDYPLSLEHFYNRWGKHLLPESELAKPPEAREAPTWVVNVAEGDTIDKEVERYEFALQLKEGGVVVNTSNKWKQLQDRYQRIVQVAKDANYSVQQLELYYSSRTITLESVVIGPLDFENYQLVCEAVIARGFDKSLLTDYVDYDTMDMLLAEHERNLGLC